MVAREVAEDLSLEFKREPYASNDKGKQELLKDVASMANAAGGLIILGIAEEEGRASALMPLALDESERLRMVGVLTQGIAPLVRDLTIVEVADPSDPTQGAFLIMVPSSMDAPHAVRRDTTFAWPVREDRQTRWMGEPEVAVRYRERFSGYAAQGRRIDEVAEEGVARLDRSGRVWFALSLAPVRAGHLPPDRDRYREWLRGALESLPGGISADAGAHRGRRRVIFTDRWDYAGHSGDHHLELHADGAGFAAIAIPWRQQIVDSERHPFTIEDAFSTLDVQVQALVLLRVLASHAVNAGSAGDFAVRAQLVSGTDSGSGPRAASAPDESTARSLVATEPFDLDGVPFGERILPGSHPLAAPRPFDVTVPASIAVSASDLISCAADVATELIAEFGSLPTHGLLRLDGSVNPRVVSVPRARSLAGWAEHHGVLATPT